MGRIARIVDVETSGLPEDEQHAVCEIGWIDLDLDTMAIRNPVTFLVNPGHPMPPHIRAIHHISDQDVAAAMLPDQAVNLLLKDLGPDDVLAAHRAAFEQAFIPTGDRKWICTWKCAMRAWQDAVSHGNQPLRYLLDVDHELDFDPAAALPPHRALPDAYVTAFILRALLRLRPIERLIEISGEPPLTANINFGKHKGQKWAELPYEYLKWIIEKSDMDADVKAQADYWLRRKNHAYHAPIEEHV